MFCIAVGCNNQPLLPSYLVVRPKKSGLCGDESTLTLICAFMAFITLGLGSFTIIEATSAADSKYEKQSGASIPVHPATASIASCTYMVPAANEGQVHYIASTDGESRGENVIAYNVTEFQYAFGSEYSDCHEGCTMLEVFM